MSIEGDIFEQTGFFAERFEFLQLEQDIYPLDHFRAVLQIPQLGSWLL